MKKSFLFIFLFAIGSSCSFSQSIKKHSVIETDRLLDSLWIHPESFINQDDPNWIRLNQHLKYIDAIQLNELIHSIFYGSRSFLLNRSTANEGFIGTLNKEAEGKKQKKFHRKMREGFRDNVLHPDNKIVMVEGDSWFEYPIFLKDITDHLEKEPNLAIYSLAFGGDWISNMISTLKYEYEYVKIKPDVFIISGGGNDMVGDYRLSNFIRINPLPANDPFLANYRNYVISRMLNKDVSLCDYESCKQIKVKPSYYQNKIDTTLVNQIVTGKRFLNKNYYRMLVVVKLEYKLLFESLRKVDPGRFRSLKIITQGYDYAIPSYKRKIGIQLLMDNGEFLKEPLMMNGINDPYMQQSIVNTLIFEVNEMLIELGKEYNNVYHVDSRGITAFYAKLKGRKPGSYWHDELHPNSKIFGIIAKEYLDIINNKTPEDKHVINVIDAFSKKIYTKK